MMPISARFLAGAGGMISANEFAKLIVLMAVSIYGLAGSVATWTRSPAWLGRIARLTWLLFFADAALRGFLRAYFGMRPGADLVLQAVLNTNPGETPVGAIAGPGRKSARCRGGPTRPTTWTIRYSAC